MILKVKGMHCDACSKLITMELEEKGINDIKVNGDTHEIEVPDSLENRVEEIKNIVNAMDSYEIV